MPNDPGRIGFVPVEPKHYPLLARWLEGRTGDDVLTMKHDLNANETR